MADTPSITIVKAFTYRGKREEFSNKYHFLGSTPGTTAAWKTLADALIASEKGTVGAHVKFVRAYGYEAGNELSVAQIDYESGGLTPVVGTVPQTSTYVAKAPPETAITVRWRTNARNSRKKWIYLRKYLHGVMMNSDGDAVNQDYITTIKLWGDKLIDGTLPGGFKYCGPQGAPVVTTEVNPFFTTRELTRRGKRPSR